MGYEESKKHLLGLSYHELQSLCKRYNLPANKSHTQLASSLALLLEASLASSPALSPGAKEASTCSQNNLKRGPYSGRDDRLLVRGKNQKGLQVAVEATSKRGIGSTSISPVSINPGRTDCQSHLSKPGNTYNVQSQSDIGIANKSTNLEPAREHRGSPANVVDQISAPIIPKHPVIDNGPVSASKHTEDTIDKGRGPSDTISANATPVQFFVMSDEGINLVVDLNSTPSTWAENFKAEVCIPSYSEPGSFSSFISSLVSKDDHSTISPSGNIVVDIQNKGAETESIAPSTNSSLGSDVGDNSHSEPCPTDTTAVNSVSSASTLPSALVEVSRYQEGAPVISSSCLTAEVQNNVTSSITAGALDSEVLPAESVDLLDSERLSAPLFDASVQPSGNNDTMSPGKTKVSGKISCKPNVSVADADSISVFSSGDVVRSTSNVLCPKSSGKQTFNVCEGAQLAHNCDTHEVLTEPMETVAMEKDTEFGDRLSISCQLSRQTVGKLPVTDAHSDASSADHCIAGPGNFDVTNPASSSAASDNTMNPLTSKCCSESVQSHDSTDKKCVCDPEELELESSTPPAYSGPPRNILLSLRSASARQTKPSTLPRRSARLVQK